MIFFTTVTVKDMEKNLDITRALSMVNIHCIFASPLAFHCGRCGDLMASALYSGASGPGSSPGRGHFVVLLVPLSTQVYKWVPANLMLGCCLRWTRKPIQGREQICS